MKKTHLLYWIPVIAWLTVIFLFSAQNAAESSRTSNPPAELLARIVSPFWGNTPYEIILDRCVFAVRKLAHFSVYTVLGVFCCNAFRGSFRNAGKLNFLFSAVLCLVCAAGDEIHQYFVPGRSCQLRDVLIDFSGAVCGIFLLILFSRFFSKKR